MKHVTSGSTLHTAPAGSLNSQGSTCEASQAGDVCLVVRKRKKNSRKKRMNAAGAGRSVPISGRVGEGVEERGA